MRLRRPGERSSVRRFGGERGTAFVAALVVMFTVTGAAAVWLARDVNQRVSDRTALQSIAFQAARAGAQQIEIEALRDDGVLVIDESAARAAARTAATRLATSYGIDAQIVSQRYGGDAATWMVTVAVATDDDGDIDDGLDTVLSATGVAHAEAGG